MAVDAGISAEAVEDLTFMGGGGSAAYAQLGHGGGDIRGNHGGAITVAAANDLTFTGGGGSFAYAQLGHGAADYDGGLQSTGARSGDIFVDLSGEVSLQDEPDPATNANYAWLGHASATADAISGSDVKLTARGVDRDAGSAPASGSDGDLSVAILDNALSGGDVSITVEDAGLRLVTAPSLDNGAGVAQGNPNDLTLSASADMTLGAGIGLANTGAGNIVLAAGRNFHNDSGTLAPIDSGSGAWAVYSTRPDANRDDIEMTNRDYLLYGLSFDANDPVPGTLPTGDGLIYAVAPEITVAAEETRITYGQTVPQPQATVTAQVDGSDVDLAAFGLDALTPIYAPTPGLDAAISTAGLTQAGTYADVIRPSVVPTADRVFGLSVAGTNADVVVDRRALTVRAAGVDKVYDGTVAAQVTFSDDRVAGDVLEVAGTASFADADAGQDKAVTVEGLSLSGADAGNYTVAGRWRRAPT